MDAPRSKLTHILVAGLSVLLAQDLAFAGPPPTFARTNVGRSFPSDARGTRVAFGDVDSDGDPDLLLGGRLLVNDGHGKFTWAPRSANMFRGARAAIFLDYDHDGDLDVFTSGHGASPDRLFRNDTTSGGGVRFRDVSGDVGATITDGLPGEGVGAGDLNGDGYPDIYVANYEGGPSSLDRLYLSDGAGKFTDASRMARSGLLGRGVSMVDYDRDGDMDIFVSNYRLQPNLLWRNALEQSGSFSIANVAPSVNVAGTQRRRSWGHTIGSVWGDLDGDGDLDLVSANLAHPGWQSFSNMTQVMLQNPDHTFAVREAGRDAGLGILYEESHSNPTLFDADNDGDLDLHLTSIYDDAFLYRNQLVEDGALAFSDVTEGSKTRTYLSWGAATADVDGDGRLDLVVCAADNKPVLFRNTTDDTFKSVRIRLKGIRSDTWGIGATVRLQGGGAVRQVRQLSIGHGTSSQSEPIVHFGVGTSAGPYWVRVEWPSGVTSRRKVKSGRVYEMTEPVRPAARPATAVVGPRSPVTSDSATSVTDLPMLQIELQAGAASVRVGRVRVQARGSGDDATEVTAVRLFNDLNGDGRLDAGEPELATAASYSGDDGVATFLGLAVVIPAKGKVQLLVTCSYTADPGDTFQVVVDPEVDLTIFDGAGAKLRVNDRPLRGGVRTARAGSSGCALRSTSSDPAGAVWLALAVLGLLGTRLNAAAACYSAGASTHGRTRS